MKQIYVSGPITGFPDHNKPAFEFASGKLKESGWEVFNPLDHGGMDDSLTWEQHLSRDLAGMLNNCDSIVFLPKWEQSRGSRLEGYVASKLGFNLFRMLEIQGKIVLDRISPDYVEDICKQR